MKKKKGKKTQRLKLGIAFGGGGAKGFAHIGVIRAFQEEKIKFDVVSGCSIGAIIGGLYASGATHDVLSELIKHLEITSIPKLFAYRILGGSFKKLICEITGGSFIEDLPVPFGAVAVDLYKGCEVRFTSGSLCDAMSASSAIPPFFKCVEVDGRTLVDGGYLNCVPCDLVKDMGADFVIGINLTNGRNDNAKIKKTLDRLFKNNAVPIANRMAKGYKYCDFMLEPDLRKYNALDFSHYNYIEEIGYLEAKRQMPILKQILKSKNI